MSAFEETIAEGAILLLRFRDSRRAKVEMAEVTCLSHEGKVRLPFVSEGMNTWQKYYLKTCGEACCFVDECGRTTCTSGGKSCIVNVTPTRGPQPVRYVCLDADCMETSTVGFTCSPCFSDPSFLHEHDLFVRISSEGEHTVVRRLIGLADRTTIETEESLPHLPLPIEGDVTTLTCAACEIIMCQTKILTSEDPPVYIPGCKHHHTILGLDGMTCGSCLLEYLKSKTSNYILLARDQSSCSTLPFTPCLLCRMLSEQEAFGNEARDAVAEARRVWEHKIHVRREDIDEETKVASLQAAWKDAILAADTALGLNKEVDQRTKARRAFHVQYQGAVGSEDEKAQVWNLLLDEIFETFKSFHPQSHIRDAAKEMIYRPFL